MVTFVICDQPLVAQQEKQSKSTNTNHFSLRQEQCV